MRREIVIFLVCVLVFASEVIMGGLGIWKEIVDPVLPKNHLIFLAAASLFFFACTIIMLASKDRPHFYLYVKYQDKQCQCRIL